MKSEQVPRLILYSKPECPLCDGLQKKLAQISNLEFKLEVRDITTCEDWFAAYQYEVPVLCQDLPAGERLIPRPSPRTSVTQLEQILQKALVKTS